MEECLFCKIIEKEIPSKKVYEDEHVYAFEDIAPMAKYHYLFVPKKHSENMTEMSNFNEIFHAIQHVIKEKEFKEEGCRVVTNINKYGGQTVFHTHFHLLAGEQLNGFGK